MASYLQYDGDVYFEAGTFAQIRNPTQQLAVHTDVLNDSALSYDKTGVLSFFVPQPNGVMLHFTIIGYNRRCCREWMSRLSDAIDRKIIRSSTDDFIAKLTGDHRKQLYIIEAATKKWLSVPEETQSTAPLSANVNYVEEVNMIVEAVKKRQLNATQEERPQVTCLVQKVQQLYPVLQARFAIVKEICLAFSFLIHCHSKNHKLDAIEFVDRIRSPTEFERCFCSYDAVLRSTAPLAGVHTWFDVYGEYTFSKLHSVYSPIVAQQRLTKFGLQFESCMSSMEFLRLLTKCKVFILGGKLFHLMTLVLFKELGMVQCDDNLKMYLPHRLTKSSGSVKLLQRQVGMKDPILCRAYMQQQAAAFGILALTYENVLCKFHVGWYNIKRQKVHPKKRATASKHRKKKVCSPQA